MENLIRIDKKVHGFKLPNYLANLVMVFYANIENLRIYLQDQKFNLESVKQALDIETGKHFKDIHLEFKERQEAKIRENAPKENLENILTKFNEKIEKALNNPLVVYELI